MKKLILKRQNLVFQEFINKKYLINKNNKYRF